MKVYKQRGSEIIYDECPFCGNQRNNFQVNVEKGVYHCWVCNAKGPIGKLNILLPHILRSSSIDVSEVVSQPIHKPLSLSGCETVLGTKGEEYLKGRGVDIYDALEWRVLYKEDRLIFPLYGDDDMLIYYVEKDLNTGRYYYPEGISKKEIVWAKFNKLRSNDILLVEGLFDAINVYKYGYDVLVLLGTNIFENDIAFIRRYKLNPILFLDGDCDIEVYKRIKKRLEDFEYMRCPAERDPGGLTSEEIHHLYQSKSKFGLSADLVTRWKR